MLFISKVPRALETKTRLFGFELGDLLLIFLYLALTNLVFGGTRLKFPIVWIGTAAIAATLYFVKRNRPDNFLQHWGEFQRSPEILSAGSPDTDYIPYRVAEKMPQEETHDEHPKKFPTALPS